MEAVSELQEIAGLPRESLTGWKQYPQSEGLKEAMVLNADLAFSDWSLGGDLLTTQYYLSG